MNAHTPLFDRFALRLPWLLLSFGFFSHSIAHADGGTNEPSTAAMLPLYSAPKQLGEPFRIGIYGQFAKVIENGLTNDSVTTQRGLIPDFPNKLHKSKLARYTKAV